jgi:hypothetical protein
VIVAAAFCPHPPVLVPDVAQGAAVELDELREACRTAIGHVAAPGRQLIVLGAGPKSLEHVSGARGTFAGFGVDLELTLGDPTDGGALELPLSLTVGAWLVRHALGPDTGAIAFSVGPDFRDSPAFGRFDAATEADTTLIVMGDGSARRSIAAPGYLDDRAASFDEQVVGALGGGDSAALSGLDSALGAELLAAGVPAWHVAAAQLDAHEYEAQLLYNDAPYGVGYFVASWTARA